ncbi:hypothetical protein [Bradyrhizobium prioriisuperbiae]|uniref:hypothetical protein n=1 Tax=Bradyrhizobium prioriisuperbiae TaxID=2854389 RepID=UPI0028ECE762|nr:hypothetical protein [Bradyrhizobium prioritasuperba]
MVRWVTVTTAVVVISALCFAFMPFLAAYASLLTSVKINAAPISVPVAATAPVATPAAPIVKVVARETVQPADGLCRVGLTDLNQATARVTELVALRRSIEDIPIVASSDPVPRPRVRTTRVRAKHIETARTLNHVAEKESTEPAQPTPFFERLFGAQPNQL